MSVLHPNDITAEKVRAWMEEVKNGTDASGISAADGKAQYDAMLAEFKSLLETLGVGHGSLDAEDLMALIGVTTHRVFGP